MPKLLQINVTANWGSTGKIAEQIGQKAIDAGWDCYLAYGRYRNPSNLHLIKVGNIFSVLWHYAESRLIDNEGLASKIATKKFLKKIDKISPDIVHLHNIHDHWMNYKMLFSYLSEKQIPVVWTMHDQWAISGHCMNRPNNCEQWRKGCVNCPMANSEYPKVLINRANRNYKLKIKYFSRLDKFGIAAVSDWSGARITKSFFSKINLAVVHNGIDISAFNIQTSKPSYIEDVSDRKIILGVSSIWNIEKGLLDFQSLSLDLDQEKYIIVLVGKVNPKDKKQNINGYPIIYVDRTQDVNELAQYYSAADVFVNPTYYDNFPTTNIEALACGTPVITYNTGGSPEAVDENTGRVVPQGDLDKLRSTIVEFLSSDFKGRHSADCRQRAERLYDKDKCFEKYLELYDELLSTKSA